MGLPPEVVVLLKRSLKSHGQFTSWSIISGHTAKQKRPWHARIDDIYPISFENRPSVSRQTRRIRYLNFSPIGVWYLTSHPARKLYVDHQFDKPTHRLERKIWYWPLKCKKFIVYIHRCRRFTSSMYRRPFLSIFVNTSGLSFLTIDYHLARVRSCIEAPINFAVHYVTRVFSFSHTTSTWCRTWE